MIRKLTHVTVIVPDYDEALDYYVNTLGFVKHTDAAFGDGMRWVTVAPKGQENLHIVLAKAFDPDHEDKIGKLTGWVFEVDDCQAEYESLVVKGVAFTEMPTAYMWGIQAIFKDKFENQFVLLQPTLN